MLLRFSFENFRTFRDKTTLSMVASSQRTHNHMLIREGNHRVLPAAILYGANASGKSNVVLAMQTLSEIVKSGTISRTNNTLLSRLELFPFVHDGNNEPIAFELEFVENKMQFIYRIAFRVDPFNHQGHRCIEEEILSLVTQNKKVVRLFVRTRDNIELGDDRNAFEFLGYSDTKMLQRLVDGVAHNMDESTLFLVGGFRTAISRQVADIIINYITINVFPEPDLSMMAFDKITFRPDKKTPTGKWMILEELFDAISKAADFGPQIIGLLPKDTNNPDMLELELASVYEHGGKKSYVSSSLMESEGTTRFLYFALRLREALARGWLFLIDEMDNSIHPEITKAILAIFCNPEINKHGAQLIFTSHNPIFMDRDLLRRDQILFVEKDPDTYKSSLYALSDFGSVSVRNDQDFIKNYFKGRYGRLPYIDLEGILTAAMEEKNEQAD